MLREERCFCENKYIRNENRERRAKEIIVEEQGGYDGINLNCCTVSSKLARQSRYVTEYTVEESFYVNDDFVVQRHESIWSPVLSQ